MSMQEQEQISAIVGLLVVAAPIVFRKRARHLI